MNKAPPAPVNREAFHPLTQRLPDGEDTHLAEIDESPGLPSRPSLPCNAVTGQRGLLGGATWLDRVPRPARRAFYVREVAIVCRSNTMWFAGDRQPLLGEQGYLQG